MNRHGSESYFVIGEGLLGESVGGRDRTLAAPVEAETAPFRFSRMGPSGINHQLPDGTLTRLAQAVGRTGGGGDSNIPAGFTYLGQFVDHDLSFDKTAVTLGDRVSPTELLQARSPSLDLDSLYGAGPDDPGSEKFYEDDGIHLRIGKALDPGGGFMEGFDLPRGSGTTAAAKRRAIIPDPRNDENLAVAQTHAALIRFHNRVVDTLPSSVPIANRFERARRSVTRHYQWMLRTDYLPRICQPGVVNDVFTNGRKAFEVGVTPTDVPTMPIEFSVAAFRLGHSMIRGAYNWNKIFDDGSGTLDWLFIFSAGSGNLGGAARLDGTWVADFRRLYDFSEAGRDDLVVPDAKFNFARRIDTKLAPPLQDLPKLPVAENDLALRNLKRARMVRLATGQQMATFLKSKGVTLTKLTAAQIREGRNGATLEGLTTTQRSALVQDTPLWFYILREAELNQGRLKGVGARIVAETFHRAMEGSQTSIVRNPTWRPRLGPNNTTFRMVDLLLFAFQGRKNRLAPLG
ncbi:MAG TPA: heme peroxidase family protein [Actinomycetota bacterium]|nr:heme peroxidase family protein [Actinomycetota bacterium]